MSRVRQPLFLARRNYRRRRAMDGSRMLPFLGMFLFVMPLLIGLGSTTVFLVYVFSVWLGLIALAALISGRLAAALNDEEPTTEDRT